MTEKLYYTDSHLFEFTARVISCEQAGEGWALELDRTAFFPEGGGQAADTGSIGEAKVTDVQEKCGHILHYTDREVTPGKYECRLDREQRLRRMQNHSGEHVVSGITHKLYGYDNVGFHMGSDYMTVDFSGELTWQQLTEIETLANETVRDDVEIRAWFPDEAELADMEYRSKLELTENVRIVEIAGIDRCACCAPHVSRTGEIGLIKIYDVMRHRGGVRVSLGCGMDALDIMRAYQTNITAISNALSAKRHETAAAVARAAADTAARKEQLARLSSELAALKADMYPETQGNICVFDSVLDEMALRELTNRLADKCGGMAAVFSGRDGAYKYIIASRHKDLRAASRMINSAINGHGGGKSEMIQGSCEAPEQVIQTFVINAEI